MIRSELPERSAISHLGAYSESVRADMERLAQIDLSTERLSAMGAEEILALDAEIAGLKDKVRHEELMNAATGITPEDIAAAASAENLGILTQDELRSRLTSASDEEKLAIDRRIDVMELCYSLGDKIREHLMQQPEAAVSSEIRKGEPTIPGGRNLSVTAWSMKGVNLASPKQQDLERYFELKDFRPSSIETEMLDRNDRELDNETRNTVSQVAGRIASLPAPATDPESGRALPFTTEQKRALAEEKMRMVRETIRQEA